MKIKDSTFYLIGSLFAGLVMGTYATWRINWIAGMIVFLVVSTFIFFLIKIRKGGFGR